MEWIGQDIYDQVSRFRNDVFLESISSGTIASGGHLGLDSNNKIVKAVDGGGDLTSIVAGTGLSGTDLTGPIPTLNVDAAQTGITSLGTLSSLTIGTTGKINFRDGNSFINSPDANDLEIAATDITLDAAGQIYFEVDTARFVSGQANDPLVIIQGEADDDTGPRLRFNKKRGADGEDGDSCGILQWQSFDDGTPSTQLYGQIETTIHDASAGEESGQLEIGVANEDGGMGTGLKLVGGSADNEVDVTVGLGTASVTTVAGTLTMGSTATLTNAGLVAVANQSNITGVGTISSGVWQGTTIKTAYIGDDQVTEDKLANTLLAEIDANTAKVTNADQSKSDIDGLAITTVGTLDTGNATAIVDAASASAAGKVELATTGEADTGTDTARAVTPAGLKSHVDANARKCILRHQAFYVNDNPMVQNSLYFGSSLGHQLGNWNDPQAAGGVIGDTASFTIAKGDENWGMVLPFDISKVEVQCSLQPQLGTSDDFTVAMYTGIRPNDSASALTLTLVAHQSIAFSSSANRTMKNDISLTADLAKDTMIYVGVGSEDATDAKNAKGYLTVTVTER